MSDWIWALLAYIVIPVFIAMRVLRADRSETLNSFCILWGVLLFLGLLRGGTIGEKLGWPLIFGMLISIPGIPTIIVLCRVLGFRLKWFA